MTGGTLKLRIVTVKCPCCKGSGIMRLCSELRCGWCSGDGAVDVKTACRYADVVNALAYGGYIAGDHDLDHARKMETEAASIYEFLGIKPKWGR
jgi:hypothetical protein